MRVPQEIRGAAGLGCAGSPTACKPATSGPFVPAGGLAHRRSSWGLPPATRPEVEPRGRPDGGPERCIVRSDTAARGVSYSGPAPPGHPGSPNDGRRAPRAHLTNRPRGEAAADERGLPGRVGCLGRFRHAPPTDPGRLRNGEECGDGGGLAGRVGCRGCGSTRASGARLRPGSPRTVG